MKLEINYKKITDSPYQGESESFFTFTHTEVEAVVNLISKMNESCYYLSGYRGVGKTSFIKKIEEELVKENGFVFIHVPVAKYEKFEILIRSFIRRFYFEFVEKNQKLGAAIKTNPQGERLTKSLKSLHRETFSVFSWEKSVTNNHSKSKEDLIISYKDEIIFFIATLITVILCSVNFESPEVYKLIAQLTSIGITIGQALKVGVAYQKRITSSREHKQTEKNLYDDEIAEYKFLALLKEFKTSGIKPVFIIDELDKLPTEEATNILYLLKSTLLSGYANFIVVGGQELFYELYISEEDDDHILSTLFSKTLHVKLKSSSELRNLLEELIINKGIIDNDDKRTAYEEYVNTLIIESKLVPRKFVNLIKDSLVFEKSRAYLNIPEEYVKPGNTALIGAIDSVSNNLRTKSDPIKDYLITNLFKTPEKLMNLTSRQDLNAFIENLEHEEPGA